MLKNRKIKTYRNNNIDMDVGFFQDLLNLLGQGITHGHPAPVHADTVNDGIRTGKVYEFKNIRRKGGRRCDLPPRNAIPGDNDSFPCVSIARLEAAQGQR